MIFLWKIDFISDVGGTIHMYGEKLCIDKSAKEFNESLLFVNMS